MLNSANYPYHQLPNGIATVMMIMMIMVIVLIVVISADYPERDHQSPKVKTTNLVGCSTVLLYVDRWDGIRYLWLG